MPFPQPVDVRGFLAAFPDAAPTEVNESSKSFKVSEFIVLVKQVLSIWKPLVDQRGSADFVPKVRELVDKLLNYFGKYAEDANESEVACFIEQYMLEAFGLRFEAGEQWHPALWMIEAFYRMQAGDYCVNKAIADVIILPFLADNLVLKEKSKLLVPQDGIEDSALEEYDEETDEETADEQERSFEDVYEQTVSEISYDDGIYED